VVREQRGESGVNLTERRRSLDMSLGECARRAGLGSAVLSRIERGVEVPPDSVLQEIASALDWSIEEVKASIPPPEEVAENYARASDALLALVAVGEDAKKRGLKKGRGGIGQIECPICKNILRYSVASINGHIWGRCDNAECVRWMQ